MEGILSFKGQAASAVGFTPGEFQKARDRCALDRVYPVTRHLTKCHQNLVFTRTFRKACVPFAIQDNS
jgi:hypothetical protein